MRLLILAGAFALGACGAPPTPATPRAAPQIQAEDAAHNKMAPLTARGAHEACSADGAWCVRVTETTAQIVRTPGQGAPIVSAVPPVDDAAPTPWPAIVTDAAGRHVWLGVIWTKTQAYSGGGASVGALSLYQLDANGAINPREALTAPVQGDADIRACFSAEDTRARLDACSDQYKFVGALRLDVANTAAAPHFVLTTDASTFPGRRGRSEDSTQARPLKQSDLVWAHDPTCSFTRLFGPGAEGQYTPDQGLPTCPDYLEQ